MSENNEYWDQCICGGWRHWNERWEVATHKMYSLDDPYHLEITPEAGRNDYEVEFIDPIAFEENILPIDATEEQHKTLLRERLTRLTEVSNVAPDQD